ncbi:hypothetical protein CcCBS67573_g04271 [Chytriomyces confervae]|uniref:Cellobiose dehydrogenase-like cytochrome domain-containing protein n=1 Tax=Chytriomyces confervae TaxID=246404 RepID=A0A507FEC8_9FUNG|nr:hypothetical protein CcCBS67573_g04271 [Chytriomyces confervae]
MRSWTTTLLGLCLLSSACAQSAETCSDDQSFCVRVEPSQTPGQSLVTVQSPTTGWAGIAIGASHMSSINAPVYIGWHNGEDIVISKRQLKGKRMPPFESAVESVSIPNTASSGVSFAFLAPSSLFAASSVKCIWAASAVPPQDPALPSSAFPFHQHRGSITLQF